MTTLACVIDDSGIHAPTYDQILTTLQSQVQSIYGSDIVLTPDSQDGQFLAIFAKAINDCNQVAIGVYNQFSPATAQGAGLSSVVKINGLRRNVASYSTVVLQCVGVEGTTITNGVAVDINNNRWNLPPTVLIDHTGAVNVTATAQELGAIAAPINSVNQIGTPTRGWQSVNNPASAAVPGAPVETDAQLRQRQAIATAAPSLSIREAIEGAIADLPGVQSVKVYENSSAVIDENGLPQTSIAAVVRGGVAQQIADAIALRKTPGTITNGSVAVTSTDSHGNSSTINYYPETQVPIYGSITLTALANYTDAIGTAAAQAVVDFINTLGVGEDVFLEWLQGPASLSGTPQQRTFKVTSVQIGTAPGSLSSSDISIAFNQSAEAVLANFSVIVSL